jgi:hypothetical protein
VLKFWEKIKQNSYLYQPMKGPEFLKLFLSQLAHIRSTGDKTTVGWYEGFKGETKNEIRDRYWFLSSEIANLQKKLEVLDKEYNFL